jgi:hypothetical protein
MEEIEMAATKRPKGRLVPTLDYAAAELAGDVDDKSMW